MPVFSSTIRIFGATLIVFFLCLRQQQPACRGEETKTYSLRQDRFPPRFCRPWLAPGGAQSPGPAPCPLDSRCREGGRNRRTLPNEIPPEFPVRYQTR